MAEALSDLTGIMVVARGGIVLQANVQAASLLGLTTRELVGQQVTTPVDGEVVRVSVAKSHETVSAAAHCSEIDHAGDQAFLLMLPEQPIIVEAELVS